MNKIGPDTVVWIKDALKRRDMVMSLNFPSVSRMRQMATASFILELGDLLGFQLDESAVYNTLPDELKTDLNYGLNGQLQQIKKAFSWLYKYGDGETFEQALQKTLDDIKAHENDPKEAA